jgi:hypothetical protein
MLKAAPAHGLTPAHPFKIGVHRKRHPLAMYCGVLFVAAAIAAMAVIATQLGTLPALVASNFAVREEGTVVGSIMLHSPANECRHKTFNNRTGQIADAGTPCNDALVDDKGVPIPMGTVHTMGSISRSFH